MVLLRQPFEGFDEAQQIFAGLDGADIESKRARVDRREARVRGGCGRPRHRRLVDDTDFGLRHAVETLQIVGGLAADGDDPPGGGGAPARGQFQVEALHGSMGAGEIAIADIMQRHDGRRQQRRRQEGHNVGRHKEHVRRAAADLPRQRPVGPQPVTRQRPNGHGALVVRGRGVAVHGFGGGHCRRIEAEGKTIAVRGQHVADDLL